MNWRKPVITSLLSLSGHRINKNLCQIITWEKTSPEKLKLLQEKKLVNLLTHVQKQVPYYGKLLEGREIIQSGQIDWSRFQTLPILTKEIIKSEFGSLQSRDKDRRHWYNNSSGGSSGIPLRFIQDRNYFDWNVANTQYYKTFVGQNLGDPELRLWGSERDLLAGSESFPLRLKNWLYHRHELNAFRMTQERMKDYLTIWNSYKPQWVEAYVEALCELVKFAEQERVQLYQPRGVLVSAGTLYPFLRKTLEKFFHCPIFNRYGSREVGGVACSCDRTTNLHLSVWSSYVEILDHELQPVKPGQIGKLYVTTLNNYSMPLIRYDIGDYASWSAETQCSCGRTTPLLKTVEGREMNIIKTATGAIVPAEFFIHFIGVVHNQGALAKFQVRQKSLDQIEISVIIKDPAVFEQNRSSIESSIKKVMGSDCAINWEKVSEIPALPNGKYQYVINEL